MLPLVWSREEAGAQQLIRHRRQQQPRRFENFPARAQAVDRFNREAFIETMRDDDEYRETFYGTKVYELSTLS